MIASAIDSPKVPQTRYPRLYAARDVLLSLTTDDRAMIYEYFIKVPATTRRYPGILIKVPYVVDHHLLHCHSLGYYFFVVVCGGCEDGA